MRKMWDMRYKTEENCKLGYKTSVSQAGSAEHQLGFCEKSWNKYIIILKCREKSHVL